MHKKLVKQNNNCGLVNFYTMKELLSLAISQVRDKWKEG